MLMTCHSHLSNNHYCSKKDEKIIRIVPISPAEIKTKSIINKEDIETKYGIVTYNPNKPNKKGND